MLLYFYSTNDLKYGKISMKVCMKDPESKENRVQLCTWTTRVQCPESHIIP